METKRGPEAGRAKSAFSLPWNNWRTAVVAALDGILAVVTQPGVEFGEAVVFDYDERAAAPLASRTPGEAPLIYEAHSTDFQTEAALRLMVRDHFAILKVGPGATFAYREALWGLAAIEQELFGRHAVPDLRRIVVEVMVADAKHWRGHYAEGEHLEIDLQYSLSDRIRYYWPYPAVQRACDALFARLDRRPIPLTLLSQYLPRQHDAKFTVEGLQRARRWGVLGGQGSPRVCPLGFCR